jgi:AraC family transcriptional regulator
MEPRIEILQEKKLVGKRIVMSLSTDKTVDLWRSFMPMRKEIKNIIGNELYSMQVYSQTYFNDFNPNTEFEKWACMEVTDFDSIPNEMESFTLKGGLYAVFLHKGTASEGQKTFQYIFETWLPNSVYVLDNRPHFEILGAKYKNEDPDSEEELWIPIKH